ncbi:MAG: AAA family ATPase [Coriobacteriia bacterium]
MIVTKLSQIRSFGLFRDFAWDAGVPDLRRFNLVYGWNRSGKTTLSRALSACERKSTDFDQYPEGGVFEVVTDTGSKIRSGDLGECPFSIRVFNQDFIDENVVFYSSACNPIVYVSKEDIEASRQLEELSKATDGLVSVRDAKRKVRDGADKALVDFREATARTIKTTLGDHRVVDLYQYYDKAKLKQLTDSVDRTEFVEMPEQEVAAAKSLIGGAAKSKVSSIEPLNLRLTVAGQQVADLGSLSELIAELTSRIVVSDTLDRLKGDPQLNAWVKRGFDLQTARDETESCPYCDKPLDDGFLDGLSRHFSEDYEALVADLDRCISSLQMAKREHLKSEVDLYGEFHPAFQAGTIELNDAIDELNSWLDECGVLLEQKRESPIDVVAAPASPPPRLSDRYDDAVVRLNLLIDQHNAKVDNHGQEVGDKKDQLAKHIVAAAMREQDYDGMISRLSEAQQEAAGAEEALKTNREAVSKLATRTSNTARAVERINQHLDELFGRNEVRLELEPGGTDYVIKREGRIAKNLSEGEKTAIAFAYFLAKVGERDFKVTDGIIVIDDPISSLDSNFVYHIFSLIRNHFSDAGQLILLTHNFELLNLAKAWFIRRNNKCRQNGNAESCGFYTVENRVDNDLRSAYVTEMDATLRNFNSEYQYLFMRLRRFADQATPTYADLYTVGNIARRFLEVYTSFKIPTHSDLRGKVEQLKTTTVTPTQKERVYRLVQEFSHSEDPTSGVLHKDKCEAQEATRLLLKIVEESDETHYKLLSKSVPAIA